MFELGGPLPAQPAAALPDVTPDVAQAGGDRGCLTLGRNEERPALGSTRATALTWDTDQKGWELILLDGTDSSPAPKGPRAELG